MRNTNVAVEVNDLFLLKQVAAGNKDALELLYKEYYGLLLNYGLKCNADKELVKDCIQDLFVGCFRNSRIRIDRITSARAYLLRALKNTLADKAVMQSKNEELDELEFNIPIDEPTFVKMFQRSDEELRAANKLMKALSELSGNQKMALYLRYVKGLSYKEVAAVMDINVQSSMNLSSRALAKLRTLIGNTSNILASHVLFALLSATEI